MNTKTNMPAVISAPREAGDSIPSIARTTATCTEHSTYRHLGVKSHLSPR